MIGSLAYWITFLTLLGILVAAMLAVAFWPLTLAAGVAWIVYRYRRRRTWAR